MTSTLYKYLQAIDLRLIAIVLSCCFSLIVIFANFIPNDDAFSYIRAAELFNEQGLNATLISYGWFWYSVLISLLSSVLPIGLMSSAHLLNIFSFALLVHAFITLATEYRPTSEVKFFAAAIILCYPTINEMRYFIVRDFAYWAFTLIALTQFIRFTKTGKLINGFGWLIAMTTAVLFRLEGLIILAFTPFILFIPDQFAGNDRTRLFAVLVGMMLATAVISFFIFFFSGINLFEIFNFAYRWYLPLLNDYSGTLTGAAENTNLSIHISDQMGSFTGKGLFVLLFGYIYSLIATLVVTISPPACLFLFYCLIKESPGLKAECKWPWLFFFGGTLLALFIFVSIMQFLTIRYAVLASLLILSLAPLWIDTFINE